MGFAKQLCVSLMIFGLVGCAGTSVKPDKNADSQGVVAKMAQSRWDALIKGDLDAAYKYLSPGARSLMSLDAYKLKTRPGMWKKVSVNSVTCGQDRCDVAITLVYDRHDMKSIETQLSEIWLQDGGGWWYVPRR